MNSTLLSHRMAYFLSFLKGSNLMEREYKCLMAGLISMLKNVSPEDLVNLVLEDQETYDACKENGDLRQAYILGAVRRYHQEKFHDEEVYKRTARFMVLLDEFLEIEDLIEEKKSKKGSKFFSFFKGLFFKRTK